MAVKKAKWQMPQKGVAPKRTLMENQDTVHKGDSTGTERKKKSKMLSVWVTPEQKAEISAYAADHNMTVSRLIIEGLEMRMNK